MIWNGYLPVPATTAPKNSLCETANANTIYGYHMIIWDNGTGMTAPPFLKDINISIIRAYIQES